MMHISTHTDKAIEPMIRASKPGYAFGIANYARIRNTEMAALKTRTVRAILNPPEHLVMVLE